MFLVKQKNVQDMGYFTHWGVIELSFSHLGVSNEVLKHVELGALLLPYLVLQVL